MGAVAEVTEPWVQPGRHAAAYVVEQWTGYLKAEVPNLFGTRDQFRGRQFFHGLVGDG